MYFCIAPKRSFSPVAGLKNGSSTSETSCVCACVPQQCHESHSLGFFNTMSREASLGPLLEVREEIFLLRDRSRSRSRSRSRRRKGIMLLSGNHAHLTASEVIKILLCNSSPVVNGSTTYLADIGKDLKCHQHTIVANRKGFTVQSSSW